MKQLYLLALLGLGLSTSAVAQRGARCAVFVPMPLLYTASHCHHHCCHHECSDSAAVFTPSRFGLYFGVGSTLDQSGTPKFGGDISGHYFLTPRLHTGLHASFTVPTRVEQSYERAAKPMISYTVVNWQNGLVLTDDARWRTTLLMEAGLGITNLRDRAQQVTPRGSCGCNDETEARKVATALAPLTAVGVSGSYKLRSDMWLTMQGQYRHWLGASQAALPGNFSHYLLTVGISMPDAPPARRRGN